MLLQEHPDLVDVGPSKAFPHAELLCCLNRVVTVVEGQLPHNSIAQLNIEDVVVLISREHGVSLVVLDLAAGDGTASRPLIGVDDLPYVLPLALGALPHVGLGHSVLLEHLDVPLLLARHGCLLADVGSFVELLQVGGGLLGLQLLLVLGEVLSLVCPLFVSREHPDLVVLSAYNEVAHGVLGDAPDRLGEVDGLFAHAVGPPDLDGAVVAARGYLARDQGVEREDEPAVTLEGVDEGAVDAPELDGLVVGAGGESEPRHLGEAPDDVVMSVVDLLLDLAVEPHSDRLVLRARDDDAVGQAEHGDGVRVALQHLLALAGLGVPDSGRAVPGATHQLLGDGLTQTADHALVAFELHGGVAFAVDQDDLAVLARGEEALVLDLRADGVDEVAVVGELPLEAVLAVRPIH
mmetsp:Transcript_7062/g.11891  ORF Transcript_7062/g.11891 Transcript_7062/m.11891 type:complete len:407 (-) Transcript_7062:202-1422(-)